MSVYPSSWHKFLGELNRH